MSVLGCCHVRVKESCRVSVLGSRRVSVLGSCHVSATGSCRVRMSWPGERAVGGTGKQEDEKCLFSFYSLAGPPISCSWPRCCWHSCRTTFPG